MFNNISENVLGHCKTAVKVPLFFAGLQSVVLLLFVLFQILNFH